MLQRIVFVIVDLLVKQYNLIKKLFRGLSVTETFKLEDFIHPVGGKAV